MRTSQEFDSMMVSAVVSEIPLKIGEVQSSPEEIQAIIDEAKTHLKPYDTASARGTCVDERPRVGLLSGENVVEVRPSTPGGPDVYGLAIAELTGVFGSSRADAATRLTSIKKTLNNVGLRSGGHEGCAADDSFGVWVPIIESESEEISKYVQHKVEEDGLGYDQQLMDEVIDNASLLKESGRYEDWNEQIYFDLLGPEAGAAIERLEPVAHKGKMKIWVDVEGMTVDQTALNNKAFILDKSYMKRIENVIANGPESTHIAALAPYARYAIVKAITFALPNEEIQEGTIK